jgi:hypothetical protein
MLSARKLLTVNNIRIHPIRKKILALINAILLGGDRKRLRKGTSDIVASLLFIKTKMLSAIVKRLTRRMIIISRFVKIFFIKEVEGVLISARAETEKIKHKAVTAFIGIHCDPILLRNGISKAQPVKSNKLMINTNTKDIQTVIWLAGFRSNEYQR